MKKSLDAKNAQIACRKKHCLSCVGACWLAHVWGDWLSLAFCSQATGIYLHSTVSCITWGKFVKSQGTGQLAIQTNRLFIPKPYPRFYVYDMNQRQGWNLAPYSLHTHMIPMLEACCCFFLFGMPLSLKTLPSCMSCLQWSIQIQWFSLCNNEIHVFMNLPFPSLILHAV